MLKFQSFPLKQAVHGFTPLRDDVKWKICPEPASPTFPWLFPFTFSSSIWQTFTKFTSSGCTKLSSRIPIKITDVMQIGAGIVLAWEALENLGCCWNVSIIDAAYRLLDLVNGVFETTETRTSTAITMKTFLNLEWLPFREIPASTCRVCSRTTLRPDASARCWTAWRSRTGRSCRANPSGPSPGWHSRPPFRRSRQRSGTPKNDCWLFFTNSELIVDWQVFNFSHLLSRSRPRRRRTEIESGPYCSASVHFNH